VADRRPPPQDVRHAGLPQLPLPATYPTRWQALRSSERASKVCVWMTAASCPSHTCHTPAELPPGWRHFTTAQKIEHLVGLDRCDEILLWGPITDLDPLRLSFQIQVMRVLLRIGLKAVLDGTLAREAARERDRERILSEMTRREFGDDPSDRTGKTRPRAEGG
jgi:hypothetical protein